jgi:hypothetical protein
MPEQNNLPLLDSNQYRVDSACVHCDGIIRHQSWCVTQSGNVYYAFQAVEDASQLNTADELMLHALGVVWAAECVRTKLLSFR